MKEPTEIERERIEALYLLYHESKADVSEAVAREFISCSLRAAQYLVNEGWATSTKGVNYYDVLHITHEGIKTAEHFRAEYDLSVEFVSNEKRNNAAANAMRIMPELISFMPVGSYDRRVVWGINNERSGRMYVSSEPVDLVIWADMTPHQALKLLERYVLPKFSHQKVIVDNPQHPEEEWALVKNDFVNKEQQDEDVITFTVEGNVCVWDGKRHVPQLGYDLPMVTFDLVKIGNKTKVGVTRGIVPEGFIQQVIDVFRAEAQPTDAAAPPQPAGINFSNLNAGGNLTINVSDTAGGNQTTTTTTTTIAQYGSTSPAAATPQPPVINKVELSKLIRQHYDLNEFKNLCFELQVAYDDLPGETLTNRVEALVEYLERRGRVPELLTLVKQERPNATWPDTISD